MDDFVTHQLVAIMGLLEHQSSSVRKEKGKRIFFYKKR